MDENSNEFAEFEAAFDDDYQTTETDTKEETGETTDTQEDGDGGEEAAEESGTDDGDGTEETDGGETEGQKQQEASETFTLKVNKEERAVSRDEMIALAQKGADYDRVKEQLTESRNTVQELQGKLDQHAGAIRALESIAAANGQTIDQITEQLELNLLMKGGKTEAEARAEMRALKAEAALKASQDKDASQKAAEADSKARVEREVAEFRKRYPDVELSEALCQELAPDVQQGFTLSESYQRREIARKDAEIAELKRQQAADQQNKRNRNSSTGSQRDSGGRREKSDFDDFMSAFE